jgi:hypothetical protein
VKKTLLITAMVGLMLWSPLVAEAKKKKGKCDRHHRHHGQCVEYLQQQIDDLQQDIDLILSGGTGGEPGDLTEKRIEAIESYISRSTGFTDRGDGTVIDNITGLIWLKDPIPGGKTLAEAETAMSNLEGGPWRLPKEIEFERILIYSDRAMSWVISPQFKTIGAGSWTVDFSVGGPGSSGGDDPIVFDFEYGGFKAVNEDTNSLEFMVLPVLVE